MNPSESKEPVGQSAKEERGKCNKNNGIAASVCAQGRVAVVVEFPLLGYFQILRN